MAFNDGFNSGFGFGQTGRSSGAGPAGTPPLQRPPAPPVIPIFDPLQPFEFETPTAKTPPETRPTWSQSGRPIDPRTGKPAIFPGEPGFEPFSSENADKKPKAPGTGTPDALKGLEPADVGSPWWTAISSAWQHFGQTAIVPIAQMLAQGPAVSGAQMAQGASQGMVDQLLKSKEAWNRGDKTESVGHALAAAVPLVGPAAAEAGEQFKSGINKAAALPESATWGERFAAGAEDLGAGVGTTTGLLLPFGVHPALKFGAPYAADALRARGPAIADFAERIGTNKVLGKMVPKSGANRARFGTSAAEIVPEIARDPILGAWTRHTFNEKVNVAAESAVKDLNAAYDAIPETKLFDLQPVIERLQDKLDSLTLEGKKKVKGGTVTTDSPILDAEGNPIKTTKKVRGKTVSTEVEPEGRGAQIASLRTALNEVWALGDRANIQNLRKLAQSWSQGAKAIYLPDIAADVLKQRASGLGFADAERVLRDYIGENAPELKPLNARYSLYKTAADVMNAAEQAERLGGTGIRRAAAAGGGALVGNAVAGPYGGVIGATIGTILDVASANGITSQIATGRALVRFADALREFSKQPPTKPTGGGGAAAAAATPKGGGPPGGGGGGVTPVSTPSTPGGPPTTISAAGKTALKQGQLKGLAKMQAALIDAAKAAGTELDPGEMSMLEEWAKSIKAGMNSSDAGVLSFKGGANKSAASVTPLYKVPELVGDARFQDNLTGLKREANTIIQDLNQMIPGRKGTIAAEQHLAALRREIDRLENTVPKAPPPVAPGVATEAAATVEPISGQRPFAEPPPRASVTLPDIDLNAPVARVEPAATPAATGRRAFFDALFSPITEAAKGAKVGASGEAAAKRLGDILGLSNLTRRDFMKRNVQMAAAAQLTKYLPDLPQAVAEAAVTPEAAAVGGGLPGYWTVAKEARLTSKLAAQAAETAAGLADSVIKSMRKNPSSTAETVLGMLDRGEIGIKEALLKFDTKEAGVTHAIKASEMAERALENAKDAVNNAKNYDKNTLTDQDYANHYYQSQLSNKRNTGVSAYGSYDAYTNLRREMVEAHPELGIKLNQYGSVVSVHGVEADTAQLGKQFDPVRADIIRTAERKLSELGHAEATKRGKALNYEGSVSEVQPYGTNYSANTRGKLRRIQRRELMSEGHDVGKGDYTTGPSTKTRIVDPATGKYAKIAKTGKITWTTNSDIATEVSLRDARAKLAKVQESNPDVRLISQDKFRKDSVFEKETNIWFEERDAFFKDWYAKNRDPEARMGDDWTKANAAWNQHNKLPTPVRGKPSPAYTKGLRKAGFLDKIAAKATGAIKSAAVTAAKEAIRGALEEGKAPEGQPSWLRGPYEVGPPQPLVESLGTADAVEAAARTEWLMKTLEAHGVTLEQMRAPNGNFGWSPSTSVPEEGMPTWSRQGWQDHVLENIENVKMPFPPDIEIRSSKPIGSGKPIKKKKG